MTSMALGLACARTAGAMAAGSLAHRIYYRVRSPKPAVHWSEAEADTTGWLFRAAAGLLVAYVALELGSISAVGIANENTQRTASLQMALVVMNVYALTEIHAALSLRHRCYYALDKDPPYGWPPVKSAVVWRVLVGDILTLGALALVDQVHEHWLSASWRIALLVALHRVISSNPLPFYTA